jgi:membrane protease YdiL (CAAX protease family)
MSIPTTSEPPVGRPAKQRIALALVFCFWLAYTVLQTLAVMERLSEPAYAAIGFLPGMLGVGALLGAGISREECYLRIAPLSWKGFGVLAGIFVFALAAILPSGVWRGWDWIAAFVYAPANGISQELFFRSALMPATLATFKKRTTLALILHSILFGLWHIGPLFLGTPAPIVAAIMLVPFLSGIGWGWQVKRDGTVVWAMIQHSLIWVVGSPFAFGP